MNNLLIGVDMSLEDLVEARKKEKEKKLQEQSEGLLRSYKRSLELTLPKDVLVFLNLDQLKVISISPPRVSCTFIYRGKKVALDIQEGKDGLLHAELTYWYDDQVDGKRNRIDSGLFELYYTNLLDALGDIA
jgi:hypothetical protein